MFLRYAIVQGLIIQRPLQQVRKTIAKAPKGGSDLAREHQDWRDTDVKMGRARSELVFVGPTT